MITAYLTGLLKQQNCYNQDDDKTIADKNEIPNIMNKYSCSIRENLKEKIPHKTNPLINDIYSVNKDSKVFLVSEIFEEEIIRVISTFKTSKG